MFVQLPGFMIFARFFNLGTSKETDKLLDQIIKVYDIFCSKNTWLFSLIKQILSKVSIRRIGLMLG
ncbi:MULTISPECIES: hypothetical protein [unclassified Sutcliffiella]|uniref:hypothetical protein n=1 Tax=unclassified Sutcliffiella TaxID=2837532 RepID=UPI0030CE3A18